MADLTRSIHEILGPGKSSAARAVSSVRAQTDVIAWAFDQLLNNCAWMGWGRSSAENPSSSDARVVTFAWDKIRDNADSATTSDVGQRTVSSVRTEAEDRTAGDTTVVVIGYTRSKTEPALTSNDAVVPNITYVRAHAEATLTATDTPYIQWVWNNHEDVAANDAGQRVVDFVRAGAENPSTDDKLGFGWWVPIAEVSPTTSDAVVPNADYVRTEDESAPATSDAITVNNTIVRTGAENPAASDAHARTHDAVRSEADNPTSNDAVVEYDGVERGASADDVVSANDAHEMWVTKTIQLSENVTANDSSVRIADYVRNKDDSNNTSDALTFALALQPRKVYMRHLVPSTAVVLQHQNWSEGAIGYNSGGGNLVHLRQGREVNMLASSVDSWSRQGLAELALLIDKGWINFHEQYLCRNTRQLTSWQARNYTATNAPWVTWVLFRTKAGAVADADPNMATLGEPAVNWDNLRVKVLITGGTNPTMRIRAWYREVLATRRGSWVEGATENTVTNLSEFVINNQGREVWLQCIDIAGTPTSTGIYLSGTTV